MKIIVCIKSIPDLDMVVLTDWPSGVNLAEPNISYVNRIMNYYDENALEMAIRLRDSCRNSNINIEVDVLTVGDERSINILRDSYAVGANSCFLIKNYIDFKENGHAIPVIINEFLKSMDEYDVILCGSSATPYENSQTPYELAELMGIPCLTGIQEISIVHDGMFVKRRQNNIEQSLTIKAKFIGVVDNIAGMRLRLPTLKNRLESNKKQIAQMSIQEIGLDIESLKELNGKECLQLYAKKMTKNCWIIEDIKCMKSMNVVLETIKSLV